VAVDLDDGGIDHGVLHVGIAGDGVSRFQIPAFTQSRKRVNTLFQVAERGRQIPPGAAGSGDPQHGLDKKSVVLAATAGIVDR
jgi:hypothetical protein